MKTKYVTYAALFVTCITLQSLYSLNIETGREFPEGMSLELAKKAKQKAQEFNAIAPAEMTQEVIEHIERKEKEVVALVQDAINIANEDLNSARKALQAAIAKKDEQRKQAAEKRVSIASQALKIAHEALEMILVKAITE